MVICRLKDLFFTLSVCTPGFYEEGATCLPCVKLISGSGGENLTDGDTNTYSEVPFKVKTATLQYQLMIGDNCVKPQINLVVTIDNSTTCHDVRGSIFIEKPHSGCHARKFSACFIMAEKQSGKRACSLNCNCAESADQCMIYIFSGITPKDISICEIKAETV